MNIYRITDLKVSISCCWEILSKQVNAYAINDDDAAGALSGTSTGIPPNAPENILTDIPADTSVNIQAAPHADIIIDIEDNKLKSFKEKYPHLSMDEVEYILTGFVFAYALLEHDGFCLHASAISIGNRAILFSAPCGTGKSTQAGLWQEYFGKDKVIIINDDKPALRLINNDFYVYGTPWSGKSALNTNIRVPLDTIVFLTQAKENRIRRLDSKEAVQMLIYQSLRPSYDKEKMNRLLILLNALMQKTPIYEMCCTVGFDAVEMLYREVSRKWENML